MPLPWQRPGHPCQIWSEMMVSPTQLPHVSSKSDFGDNVWRFDHIPPGNVRGDGRIDWAFEFPGRLRFTDPDFDGLRNTAKHFLLSLRDHPPSERPSRADQGLTRTFIALRTLLRWMEEQGLTRFAGLDRVTTNRFLTSETDRRHHVTGQPLKATTILKSLRLVNELWMQRSLLDDAPPEDPLNAEWAHKLRKPRPVGAGHPYTPDEIVVPLLAAALRLIGQPAEDVIALRDQVQRHYDNAIGAGLGRTHAGRIAIKEASSFQFSTLPGEAAPWEAPFTSTKRLRYLLDRVTDACFVLIAWMVGPRASEIVGLTCGCIEERAAADGAETYHYLVGRIWKAAGPGGRQHRWPAPAPVVNAITLMERLSEPMRLRTGRHELWLAMGSTGVMGPTPRIELGSKKTWLSRLNTGFASYIDLPNFQGNRWHLSTTQGRKTFARMVAKRDRTGLDALRAHLGHIARAMTDRHYVGTDFDLKELVDHHALDETRTALEALLTAPRLGGRAGRAIAARSQFRGRVIDAEVRTWVGNVLRETDMRLGTCDWGWCLYRRESASCLGDEHGPNPVLRTESICAGCANFAVAQRHRPVWERRRQRNNDLLAFPDLDSDSRTLAQARIAECDRILLELDNPGPDTAASSVARTKRSAKKCL